ncbi:iron dicitrate transport regulator FecR [Achromobacter denitrificans]|uniref:FecR domain-containing protein n=1 Tax=Achromobacter denitrificans TaxID=32002 RepID=UPI000B4D50F0|nr:FecR family protein [Achromobacter denitrificans]ASC65316.1 iron dicitrate transport regulator FecR [Achromobacter denitrificans]
MSAGKAAGIDPRALDGAIEWFLVLTSGTVTDADQAAWLAWRQADPEHERAWRRTEALTRRFEALPEGALPVLARPRSPGRRRALVKLAVLAGAGAAGWSAWRETPWQTWTAQYRTPDGARRELALADNSRIVLNTRTAIDVLFDRAQRLVALHAGEILVDAVPDRGPEPRPFVVRTSEGLIMTASARFVARHDERESRVQVLAGDLRVQPLGASRASVVPPGTGAAFSAARAASPEALAGDPSAWARGMLQVDGMPLAEFLAELQRYRPGWIDCAPEVADLPISGSFPLADTDRALAAVADTLPLRLRYRTRYWVSVLPRDGAGLSFL